MVCICDFNFKPISQKNESQNIYLSLLILGNNENIKININTKKLSIILEISEFQKSKIEIYLTNMKDNKYFLLFNFDNPILIESFNKNQIKIEIDKIIENYHLNSTYILGKKWQFKIFNWKWIQKKFIFNRNYNS